MENNRTNRFALLFVDVPLVIRGIGVITKEIREKEKGSERVERFTGEEKETTIRRVATNNGCIIRLNDFLRAKKSTVSLRGTG